MAFLHFFFLSLFQYGERHLGLAQFLGFSFLLGHTCPQRLQVLSQSPFEISLLLTPSLYTKDEYIL